MLVARRWTRLSDLAHMQELLTFGYLYIILSEKTVGIGVYVQFSRSVMSDCLRPHGLQYTRPPFPSPTTRAYLNSCPLSWWYHPTISSSVIPFSSHLQSFPASGSFQMSQFFTSGGQSIGVSASSSVLPMNIQDWFPSRVTIYSLDILLSLFGTSLLFHVQF